MLIFYFIQQIITQQITLYQICKSDTQKTLQQITNQLNLTFVVQQSNKLYIQLNNTNKQSIQYEWDLFEYDIKYWLNIYFYDQLPTLNMPLKQYNKIQENLIILYSNNIQYYQIILNLTYQYPLYIFLYVNPYDNQLYKEFFIQNYSLSNDYIFIRRNSDNYDNILQIQNITQIKLFLEQYCHPYQQQYFTMKQINYLKINKKRAFIYIGFDLFQFKQQKQILQKLSHQWRQSGQMKNIFFIITEPIFQAKTLLQRFLYKKIKEGPYLIYLEFNKFKFTIYNKEWQHYQISQWIKLYINNEFQSSVYTLNQYLQLIPYTELSQQIIQTPTKNKLHSINILDMVLKKPLQQKIILIRLIPYCYESFKLFSNLSKTDPEEYLILYSVNELIYNQYEGLMITANETIIYL